MVVLGEQGIIWLVVSRALVAEVEGVLERKFAWTPRRIRRIFTPVWKSAHFAEPTLEIHECRDPKDNHLLALAAGAGAQFLITGDRDLLVLNPFRRVRIQSPREFLESEPWKSSRPV